MEDTISTALNNMRVGFARVFFGAVVVWKLNNNAFLVGEEVGPDSLVSTESETIDALLKASKIW